MTSQNEKGRPHLLAMAIGYLLRIKNSRFELKIVSLIATAQSYRKTSHMSLPGWWYNLFGRRWRSVIANERWRVGGGGGQMGWGDGGDQRQAGRRAYSLDVGFRFQFYGSARRVGGSRGGYGGRRAHRLIDEHRGRRVLVAADDRRRGYQRFFVSNDRLQYHRSGRRYGSLQFGANTACRTVVVFVVLVSAALQLVTILVRL